MTEAEYEYYGMMAETWDLFRGDTSGWPDRAFYLEMIHKSGEPALDVGCGTGRLLLDYLTQGVDIDGVEISPEMVEICLHKAEALGLNPRLYLDDMVTMRLPRKYQTIIVPSSSFQLVTDEEAARKAMLNLNTHLLPGGTLVMPFMKLWKKDSVNEWELNGEAIRPGDGALVRRWSFTRYDPQTQLEHNEDRYEVFKDGIKVGEEYHVRSPATREYTFEQAVAMYVEAAFTDIQVYNGFTFDEYSKKGDLFTISGKKKLKNHG